MEKHINSVKEVDASKLTFADLRWKYSTGETYTKKRGGKNFEYYIPGVMTEIGDIRRDVWEQLMYDLIVRSGEEELYRQMYAWFKDGVMYYSSEAETKKIVLRSYSLRLFDDPEWCNYIAFNKKYRPWVLQNLKEKQTGKGDSL